MLRTFGHCDDSAGNDRAYNLLSIRNLTKVLVSGDARFTLKVPTFDLRQGGIYGLVGRSGAGKSTLLDLLALVSRPTSVDRFKLGVFKGDTQSEFDLSGFAENPSSSSEPVDDNIVSHLRNRYFGYVLQSGGLFPFLSVLDNLELPFRFSGRPFSPEKVRRLASRFDLTDQMDKKPSALSGGQRQRVCILRALIGNPALLLADEPTASVDAAMGDIILNEMRAIANEQNTTVVLVSHDLALVEAVADTIVPLIPHRFDDGSLLTECGLGGGFDVLSSEAGSSV